MKILMAAVVLLGIAFLTPFGKAQTAQSVAGGWEFVLQTDGGDRVIEANFVQEGEQITGKWGKADVKGTFSNGQLSLEFPLTSDEIGPGTMTVKGKFVDKNLGGDWNFQGYGGKFTATRTKDTGSH